MRVAGYDIREDPVARGAQGAVYFGTRVSDGLGVAIKVAADSKPARRALLREMELLRTMQEAGVEGTVELVESIRINEHPAMVMPRYSSTLSNWLATVINHPKASTLDDIFVILAAVARTLAQVHQVDYGGATVVHRDVKPENIFLDSQLKPRLGDFGGAMAIEGLKAVELALFGTPMWAPLDQILPGNTIPDPTWDTYALCVMLYGALTGARPAYQADPREFLTENGRQLWTAARKAVEAPGTERKYWHQRFAKMRTGTSTADLVDLTGHAALIESDREVLRNGITALAQLAGVDEKRTRQLERALWGILVRGLSPASHPSPPNRYRDALELADALDDLRDLLEVTEVTDPPADTRRLKELLGDGTASPDVTLDRPPRTTLSAGPPVALALVGIVVCGGGLGAAAWFHEPLTEALILILPQPERVTVGAIELDRTEFTVGRCAQLGLCEGDTTSQLPVTGLRINKARSLCDAAGGRLPTEAEWRQAAGDGSFPWGEAPPDCSRAIALGCATKPQKVGQTISGRSAAGALDLAGNVWEWVDAAEGPVLMGGGTNSGPGALGVLGRAAPESVPVSLTGVRCAYD